MGGMVTGLTNVLEGTFAKGMQNDGIVKELVLPTIVHGDIIHRSGFDLLKKTYPTSIGLENVREGVVNRVIRTCVQNEFEILMTFATPPFIFQSNLWL